MYLYHIRNKQKQKKRKTYLFDGIPIKNIIIGEALAMEEISDELS